MPALRPLALLAALLTAPLALRAQGTAGDDVLLHFILPVNSAMEKDAIELLRAHGESVPMRFAADGMRAKFTPEGAIDLNAFSTDLQGRGLPLWGVEVIGEGAHTFLAVVPSAQGSAPLQPMDGPDDALRDAAKRAWAAARPDLYEQLNRGNDR